MSKKNVLAESDMSDKEIKKLYKQVKKKMGINNKNLDDIFDVAMLDREALFPNQNKNTEKECLEKWIKGYISSTKNLPSSHIGNTKRTCSDPSLATIVKVACNLFMSAENIQGELLEEYIARNIEGDDWIWCSGNTLRAVDFCKRDGSALLQIKNKDNTENSSSNAIRNGTKIKKWHRLKTITRNKIPIPSYRWDKLNKIINKDLDNGAELCNMSEEDYQDFLKEVVTDNPDIISEE